jgi:hypothetical protein
MEDSMSISRRSVICAAGGAGLALIGTGATFAVTRTPVRALTPWRQIEGAPPGDIRLDPFRHAILAPNPHNRQPWLIRLGGRDQATIFCDLDRRLPETDPFDRQILIGFGCFLELARLTAAERGVRMEITAFPEGEPGDRLDKRPIASLRFVADPSGAKDPLFHSIAHRRSNKQAFDTARPVEPRVLEALVAQQLPEARIAATADDALVRRLRALTWDAWKIELETERTWLESVKLMRIGKLEIEANPDGISLGGPLLEALSATGQLSRELMVRKGTIAYDSGVDRYRSIMSTGMAYGWVVTDGNTRRDQLAAGKAYVRMNLEAARLGVGLQPVSQALQEFPEMAATLTSVNAMLGVGSAQRVQMLARLGYAAVPGQTPRWPLESRLVQS